MPATSYLIEKLTATGLGFSRDSEGKATLIDGVIPGETVTAGIITTAKKHNTARVKVIKTASKDRTTPPCPHYKQCGGCNMQHMTYQRQLKEKSAILNDIFSQSRNRVLQESTEKLLHPVLPSPQDKHYRQRIRLQVDSRQVLGFHKRRSHDCVAIDSCLLAHPAINSCLRKILAQHAFKKLLDHTESLDLLLDPESLLISILLHFRRKPRPTDEKHGHALVAAITELKSVFFTGTGFAVTGRDTLCYSLTPETTNSTQPLKLSFETGGFCQVNVSQNNILVKTVLDFCNVSANETVLDLFCGMGNFSIPLAEQAQSLLGVEGQGSAIRSARKNSANAGLKNTEFRKQPIHAACSELAENRRHFDCLVIDPPRQGVPGLAKQLANLCEKKLVYVSCDPATLCRDLGDLLHHGFHLQKLQPIDMFPQTSHIESVVLLTSA